MRRPSRRLRAHLHYLRRPILRFVPLLLLLVAVVIAGGVCFRELYREEPLSLSRAIYITYCLVFLEHLLPYPQHWLLQAFYYMIPMLGLMVILDGLVRFGYHVLRRDETSREWTRAMSATFDNHVILFGLGKLGLRVLERLLELGELVAAVEKDPQCPNIAYAQKQGVPVTIGTGREAGLLQDLNVRAAKSIILATDDDLANLELAMDARKEKPGIRVVLRMFDHELATKVRESFGIDLSFSTSELAAPLFATASSDRSILNAFYLGDRLLVVAAIALGPQSTFIGRQVHELTDGQHLNVLSLERGGARTLYPAGDTLLAPGDRLTIQTEPPVLKEIHRQNGDKGG
jgi:Trk K+ transport system NAD-binding subunit